MAKSEYDYEGMEEIHSYAAAREHQRAESQDFNNDFLSISPSDAVALYVIRRVRKSPSGKAQQRSRENRSSEN